MTLQLAYCLTVGPPVGAYALYLWVRMRSAR